MGKGVCGCIQVFAFQKLRGCNADLFSFSITHEKEQLPNVGLSLSLFSFYLALARRGEGSRWRKARRILLFFVRGFRVFLSKEGEIFACLCFLDCLLLTCLFLCRCFYFSFFGCFWAASLKDSPFLSPCDAAVVRLLVDRYVGVGGDGGHGNGAMATDGCMPRRL